jgi:hypothetical protein
MLEIFEYNFAPYEELSPHLTDLGVLKIGAEGFV